VEYLPLCLKIAGEPVLLVGGGAVATRKARLLLRAGGHLTVVAPTMCKELRDMLEAQGGTWENREYRENDMRGARLVVAATGNRAVNERVADDSDGHCVDIPLSV